MKIYKPQTCCKIAWHFCWVPTLQSANNFFPITSPHPPAYSDIFSMTRALPEMVKKQKALRRKNEVLQHTVEEWKAELVRPEKDCQSWWEVAQGHGVSPNTMHSHAIGNQTMSAFNTSKQNLSPVLHHGRDVHPTWVKSFTKTLGSGFLRFCSTRAKSKEDFDSYWWEVANRLGNQRP